LLLHHCGGSSCLYLASEVAVLVEDVIIAATVLVYNWNVQAAAIGVAVLESAIGKSFLSVSHIDFFNENLDL